MFQYFCSPQKIGWSVPKGSKLSDTSCKYQEIKTGILIYHLLLPIPNVFSLSQKQKNARLSSNTFGKQLLYFLLFLIVRCWRQIKFVVRFQPEQTAKWQDSALSSHCYKCDSVTSASLWPSHYLHTGFLIIYSYVSKSHAKTTTAHCSESVSLQCGCLFRVLERKKKIWFQSCSSMVSLGPSVTGWYRLSLFLYIYIWDGDVCGLGYGRTKGFVPYSLWS